MRKVFLNKWFILGIALTTCLSAFSYSAFNADEVCKRVEQSCKNRQEGGEKSELFWDLISRQLPSVSFQ